MVSARKHIHVVLYESDTVIRVINMLDIRINMAAVLIGQYWPYYIWHAGFCVMLNFILASNSVFCRKKRFPGLQSIIIRARDVPTNFLVDSTTKTNETNWLRNTQISASVPEEFNGQRQIHQSHACLNVRHRNNIRHYTQNRQTDIKYKNLNIIKKSNIKMKACYHKRCVKNK